MNARWISNSKTFWLSGSLGSMPRSTISSIVRRRDSSAVWATSPAVEVDGERAAAVGDAGGGGDRQVAGRERVHRDVTVGQPEQPGGAVAAGDTGEAHAVGVEGEDVGAVEQRAATADGDEQAGLGRRVDDGDDRRVDVLVTGERQRQARRRTCRRRSASSRPRGPSSLATGSPVVVPHDPAWHRRADGRPRGRAVEVHGLAERDDLVVAGVGDERLGAADPHHAR